MIRILLFLVGLLPIVTLSAQDIHLSQFYTNNQMVNPALVGDNAGDTQIGVNYRNQWPEINRPLTTSALFIEKRLYNDIQEYQMGLLVVNDRFEPFDVNRIGISLSFGYPLRFGKHRITPGIQGGIVFVNTDYTNRSHPSQWNYTIGEFDQSIASGEGQLEDRIQYPDVSAGFTHQVGFGSRNSLRWGYAVHHLNKPNVSRINKDKLPMRHTGHLGLILDFNDRWQLLPDFRMMTTTKTENLMLGSRILYKQKGSFYNGVYLGGFYRSNLDYQDAIIPVFGIILKTIDIGVSYDMNISELSDQGDRKSTLELSFRYQTPSSSPDQFTVPCIRY